MYSQCSDYVCAYVYVFPAVAYVVTGMCVYVCMYVSMPVTGSSQAGTIDIRLVVVCMWNLPSGSPFISAGHACHEFTRAAHGIIFNKYNCSYNTVTATKYCLIRLEEL